MEPVCAFGVRDRDAMNASPTVMIADDVSMMGELLRTMLRQANCLVVASATNGDDAVRAYHRFQPDMVFLDINMPGKNGMEVLQEIIANNPAAHVVMISVESSVEHVRKAMELGAKSFLVKPVSALKIQQLVRNFIGKKKAGRH